MRFRVFVLLAALIASALLSANAAATPAGSAGEYSQHFSALEQLSVAVAQAMPTEQYGFRSHPDSMDFSQLMAHIATTNYWFCAGLKDSAPPALPSPRGKGSIIRSLSESFQYCSGVIPSLTAEQLEKPHNSPDGRLSGREVLLAMYVHIAHHRGQAEIYLRNLGIKPPQYMI